jgi:hypothetical protein
MLWEFALDIKHGGKYSNPWDVKEFANSYITYEQELFLLVSICLLDSNL